MTKRRIQCDDSDIDSDLCDDDALSADEGEAHQGSDENDASEASEASDSEEGQGGQAGGTLVVAREDEGGPSAGSVSGEESDVESESSSVESDGEQESSDDSSVAEGDDSDVSVESSQESDGEVTMRRQDVDALRRELAAWKEKALRLETRVSSPSSRIAPNGKAIVSKWNAEHPYSLGMSLPPEWQKDGAGTIYKKQGIGFPHSVVALDGSTGFVVEARSRVTVAVKLRDMVTGRSATEFDLADDGPVTVKLELIHSDGTLVNAVEYGVQNVFDPPDIEIAEKHLTRGSASWALKIKTLSLSTKRSDHQNFKLRVRVLNESLSHLSALSFVSPFSFRVVARLK